MFLDWGSARDHLPELLAGVWVTIYISAIGFAFAFALSWLIAAGRLSTHRSLRSIATIYVEIIRNTPLLLQMYVVFYGFPSLGIRFSATNAAIAGIALNVGAYMAEILRAGIRSVPPGQLEAASALGLSRWHSLLYVTVPCCLRNVFPSLINMVVATILGSSLASVIAVGDLTGQTNAVSARTFLTIEIYAISAVLYLTMTLGSAVALGALQTWLFPRRSRA